jgi:uncharacterized protein YqjF (DUF2071 family)
LTVDTFDGRAWIGLVPFWMTGVRMTCLPPIKGFSTFPETNVRTYVHREGRDPGVWFFSLDASNLLAVLGARAVFGLPYYFSRMKVANRDRLHYISQRYRSNVGHDLEVALGDPMDQPLPGSLEFFLIERYLLYSVRRGSIWTGRVHHAPYELRHVTGVQGQQGLLDWMDIVQPAWEHKCFSPGVDVEVFGIQRVG